MRYVVILDGDPGGDAGTWLARFDAIRVLPSAWILETVEFPMAGDVAQSLTDFCPSLRRALVLSLPPDYSLSGEPIDQAARALMRELG
jgi:hypothetical protein